MNTKKVTLYVDPIVNTTFSIIIWDPIIEFFLIISNSLKKWGNYILPTYGLPEKHFANPWFKNWHFTHLGLAPFISHYSSLLKIWVNLFFFCYPFMSL